MTRASTMLLALLLMTALMGVVCLVVGRVRLGSVALRKWGWGNLIYAAGILITIPEALPFDLRKVVGNALIAYAPIVIFEGVITHTGVRIPRRWLLLGLALSVAPIVYNHLGGHFVLFVDIVSPAPIANVLLLIAAVALVRDPPPDARAAARFLAATLVFAIVVWTARIGWIWQSLGGSNDRDRADLVIALFGIAQLVISMSTTLALLWIEVRKMEAELRRLADTDALTGLPNRRATMARFALEAARAARLGGSLALALFDVDHFKRFNDMHGHQVGDAVLRHVAALLRAESRGDEAVGRIGGEEFVVLFANPTGDGALGAAERVRAAIEAAPLPHDARALAVTVSGGVALYPGDGTDWDGLFFVADHRLYEAKRGGRNRVEGPPA